MAVVVLMVVVVQLAVFETVTSSGLAEDSEFDSWLFDKLPVEGLQIGGERGAAIHVILLDWQEVTEDTMKQRYHYSNSLEVVGVDMVAAGEEKVVVVAAVVERAERKKRAGSTFAGPSNV